MSLEKQETTKINQGTPTQGNVSPKDSGKESCKVHHEWNWQEEQETLDKERADLEEMKVKLKLHQKSIDDEEQITKEISKSLKILHIKLNECSLIHVEQGQTDEKKDKTSLLALKRGKEKHNSHGLVNGN